jgi:hypothetical protein
MSQADPPKGPPALSITEFFPVDRDCAIAELEWYGEQIASVTLEGLDLEAEGAARTANARAVVEFYGPLTGTGRTEGGFEIPLSDMLEKLAEAEQWLRSNEEGREPMSNWEGLTQAGAAFAKMSDEEQRLWLERLEQENEGDS